MNILGLSSPSLFLFITESGKAEWTMVFSHWPTCAPYALARMQTAGLLAANASRNCGLIADRHSSVHIFTGYSTDWRPSYPHRPQLLDLTLFNDCLLLTKLIDIWVDKPHSHKSYYFALHAIMGDIISRRGIAFGRRCWDICQFVMMLVHLL